MIDLIGEGSFGKASKHRPADANATVMCMGANGHLQANYCHQQAGLVAHKQHATRVLIG